MLYLSENQLTVKVHLKSSRLRIFEGLTAKAARPPKSGVLTYKFCVIAVQLIFLCVY
ncbi:hypothetical protein C812_03965, partial [Paenibacillus barengoltzii G22]